MNTLQIRHSNPDVIYCAYTPKQLHGKWARISMLFRDAHKELTMPVEIARKISRHIVFDELMAMKRKELREARDAKLPENPPQGERVLQARESQGLVVSVGEVGAGSLAAQGSSEAAEDVRNGGGNDASRSAIPKEVTRAAFAKAQGGAA